MWKPFQLSGRSVQHASVPSEQRARSGRTGLPGRQRARMRVSSYMIQARARCCRYSSVTISRRGYRRPLAKETQFLSLTNPHVFSPASGLAAGGASPPRARSPIPSAPRPAGATARRDGFPRMVERARQHRQQIIVVARHQVAAQHGGAIGHRLLTPPAPRRAGCRAQS